MTNQNKPPSHQTLKYNKQVTTGEMLKLNFFVQWKKTFILLFAYSRITFICKKELPKYTFMIITFLR